MRAVEATAIRLKDIDFSTTPTKIHIRKEYAKTRAARDVYISDEATQYLKQWIDWKHRLRQEHGRLPSQEDLVFSIYSINKEPNPSNLYVKLIREFQKLLAITGMAERKESGIHKRRKITLHSLRRFCKSVISNQVNQDYSEWFLGHSKSPYYTLKESEKRKIYVSKVMKYLTLLDYTTLEATGKNIEAKLTEKKKEIQQLKQYQEIRDDAMSSLSDQVAKLMQEIAIMKENQKITYPTSSF
jgi:tRNA nucleotidyltransferase/poly(A) polymerase